MAEYDDIRCTDCGKLIPELIGWEGKSRKKRGFVVCGDCAAFFVHSMWLRAKSPDTPGIAVNFPGRRGVLVKTVVTREASDE